MRKAVVMLWVACLALLPCAPALAERLAPAEKAALQAAMAQHIDRQLVEDSYMHLDVVQGTVRALVPAKTHSRIIQVDSYYVLCTDFRNQQGAAVEVDFYIMPTGPSFLVFHTEIGNRAPLRNLLRIGRARAVE